MKYKPIIWLFMTGRMKRGLKEIWPETNALLKKAKPIYKDLLKKVEGVRRFGSMMRKDALQADP
jgi:hypothetical protein